MTLGAPVACASVLYLGGATLFGYRPDWIRWGLATLASLLPETGDRRRAGGGTDTGAVEEVFCLL